MSSSVGMMTFPIYGKIKIFQTTNQQLYMHLGPKWCSPIARSKDIQSLEPWLVSFVHAITSLVLLGEDHG